MIVCKFSSERLQKLVLKRDRYDIYVKQMESCQEGTTERFTEQTTKKRLSRKIFGSGGGYYKVRLPLWGKVEMG